MYALRSLREERGYSQKDIAAALNVAPSTYNQWETGKREPDNATLLRIADFFHVTTDCLLGHSIVEDQPKPAPDIEAAKVALFGGDGVIPPIIDAETWRKVRERMSDNKSNAKNKARHSYLLSGLIVCEACGAAYVGHASTNKKGYTTRYYVCGNKYRTRSCASRNINADEIETFVVQQLKAYLLDLDFEETAQRIADQVNGASPDLTAERAELVSVSSQIANGMKALLRGMEFPELEEEIGRLRTRKAELEDIIAQRESEHPTVDPADIVQLLQESVDTWDPDNVPQIIRKFVHKIYASSDGSYSVELGVHLTGCGGAVYIVCATFRKSAA